jgi:lysylphosphatidylglycerol synthetase-like protein (DUF2156 family)
MDTPSKILKERVKSGVETMTKKIGEVIPINNGDANGYPILNYIIFFIVFLMAFIAIYVKNAALIGVVLLYVINIVYSMVLIKDMFSSKKSEQIITFIITAILVLNAVSSTMVIFTFKSLHERFNKKKETIKLSAKSKKQMSDYFTMFIATIAFTWFLAMFYFGDSETANFFDYTFVGKSIPPKLLVLIFILKISTCIAGLGLSAYMVYLSDEFSKLKRSQYV